MRPRAAIGWLLVVGVSGACFDFSIDPSAIAAIEFPVLASPSIIEGDTLRREDLTKQPLEVRVFAGDGSLLPEAPVTFFIADTLTAVSGGFLIADTPLAFTAGTALTSRIVASVGAVQSVPRTIAVVPRPTLLERVDQALTTDTINYSAPALATDTSMALRVRLSGSVVVPSYLVRFQLTTADSIPVPTTDSSFAFFMVADDGKITDLDTTDASGQASRRVRFRIRQGQNAIDTVRVLAQVRVPGQLFQPIVWSVIVRPRTP